MSDHRPTLRCPLPLEVTMLSPDAEPERIKQGASPCWNRCASMNSPPPVRRHQKTALRLRSSSRKVRRLEDLRPKGFLDTCIVHPEEARAIGRVSVHSGFEDPDDFKNP